jgi:non-heme chloroperoxidase
MKLAFAILAILLCPGLTGIGRAQHAVLAPNGRIPPAMQLPPRTSTMSLAAPWVAPQTTQQDRSFVTSDGVRLHYLESGRGRTVVFVPGWSMPAWIWQRQIEAFSRQYRVIAFDPRAQGNSEIAPSGYDHVRRGADIAELLATLGPEPVVLVGWSLGVLDTLAYIHADGDRRVAGLVLVDNSIGENPPPQSIDVPMHRRTKPLPREMVMRNFVRGMFAHPQAAPWLDKLTQSALRMPEWAARALLSYPVPRTYWREAVYSTSRPLLYLVRPRFEGQAANLAMNYPGAETAVWRDVGHAMFVDDPQRFNALLRDFIGRRVWP